MLLIKLSLFNEALINIVPPCSIHNLPLKCVARRKCVFNYPDAISLSIFRHLHWLFLKMREHDVILQMFPVSSSGNMGRNRRGWDGNFYDSRREGMFCFYVMLLESKFTYQSKFYFHYLERKRKESTHVSPWTFFLLLPSLPWHLSKFGSEKILVCSPVQHCHST